MRGHSIATAPPILKVLPRYDPGHKKKHVTQALSIVEALAIVSVDDIGTVMELRQQARALVSGIDLSPLTDRERDALEAIQQLNGPNGYRRRASTQAVAVKLNVDRSWAYRLCASLRSKGYVKLVGRHLSQTWVIMLKIQDRVA